MARAARLAAALAASASVAAAAGASTVTRATTAGPVVGTLTDDGMGIFRSVPFAAPPVGDLRFRAPQPPAPWAAPRDVTAFPPPCPQLKLDGSLFVGQEDCLYLSVYVPGVQAAAGLPVLFWIYGGAFVVGDEEEFGMYDGAALANATGHIIVAPAYRVGPFGFMALGALAGEDPDGSTGNAAMQDQVAALRWVAANIAAFGGNASRVTIFGESAGGFSVGWHLASPSSAGLFHGAIMESGTTDAPQFFQRLPDAVAFNALYASALGCNESAPAPAPAPAGADPQLACLRAKTTQHVMESLWDMFNPSWPDVGGARAASTADCVRAALRGRLAALGAARGLPAAAAAAAAGAAATRLPALSPLMPWGPAIDGRPTGTVDMPLALIQRGAFNRVPLVLGTNHDEGTIFVPAFVLIDRNVSWPPADGDLPAIVRQAFSMFPPAAVVAATDVLMQSYPSAAYPTGNFERAAAMIKHAFFSCAARRTARALDAAGVPVWEYRWSFNATSHPLWALLGDAHGSELTYVFRNQWFEAFNADDWAMADAFTAYWGNMAAHGDPNVGAPVPAPWPRFAAAAGGGAEAYLEIQKPVAPGAALDAAVCDAWDAFATAIGDGV